MYSVQTIQKQDGTWMCSMFILGYGYKSFTHQAMSEAQGMMKKHLADNKLEATWDEALALA